MMMIQTSNKDEKFAQMAMNEARKSMLLSQHGCVAVYNGQVIARGHNTYQCTSKDGFLDNCCTCHAEINVLRQLYSQYGRCTTKAQQKKINKKKKQKQYTNNQLQSDDSESSDDGYDSPQPFSSKPNHRSHESRQRRRHRQQQPQNTLKVEKNNHKISNLSFLPQCEKLCFQPKKPKVVCGT